MIRSGLQVTCGGLQSAHCAAFAAICAERGLRSHLLVRGERPAVPAGYVKHFAATDGNFLTSGVCLKASAPPARPALHCRYHLLTRMFGHCVTYVPRGEYADRSAMFARHVARVQAAAPAGSRVRYTQCRGASDARGPGLRGHLHPASPGHHA